ncbi:hypothetical protein ACA910_006804 [Epithemia clementina (nom. ined.)]
METLSDELLFAVLGFVPPHDLLCSATRVSKSWNALIRNHQFWQNHPLFLSSMELHKSISPVAEPGHDKEHKISNDRAAPTIATTKPDKSISPVAEPGHAKEHKISNNRAAPTIATTKPDNVDCIVNNPTQLLPVAPLSQILRLEPGHDKEHKISNDRAAPTIATTKPDKSISPVAEPGHAKEHKISNNRAAPTIATTKPDNVDCIVNNPTQLLPVAPLSQILSTHQIKLICLYTAASVGAKAANPRETATEATQIDEEEDSNDAINRRLPFWLRPKSVLPTKEEAEFLSNASLGSRRCCTASTTDHYGEQLTNALPRQRNVRRRADDEVNVLDTDDGNAMNRDRLFRNFLFGQARRAAFNGGGATRDSSSSWWSSKPSFSMDSTETLLFAIHHPYLALLTGVHIKPLADPQHPEICYTWKETVVKLYRLPVEQLQWTPAEEDLTAAMPIKTLPGSFPVSRSNPTATSGESENNNNQSALIDRHNFFLSRLIITRAPPDHATIEATLQGHEPVFESKPFTIPPHSDDVYKFPLPDGGVVANVITIELIGKNHEQFPQQGYFACVERVNVLGIPLI